MWQYTPTEELYHWGVKGMRWGHRKAKDSGGGTGKPKSKQDQIDELKSDMAKMKNKQKAKTAAKIALGTIGAAAVTTVAVKTGKRALNVLLYGDGFDRLTMPISMWMPEFK